MSDGILAGARVPNKHVFQTSTCSKKARVPNKSKIQEVGKRMVVIDGKFGCDGWEGVRIKRGLGWTGC
jgi:hypothetical protein